MILGNKFYKTKKFLPKYALFSTLAMTVDISILFSLTQYVHINYLISATISYICGLIVSFILQRNITFKNYKDKIYKQFSKYFLFWSTGLLLNISIIGILVSFGLWYIFARLISGAIIFFWGYFLNKRFTFKV